MRALFTDGVEALPVDGWHQTRMSLGGCLARPDTVTHHLQDKGSGGSWILGTPVNSGCCFLLGEEYRQFSDIWEITRTC
jgi:hypothetical protein